jgi:hypothetical protein
MKVSLAVQLLNAQIKQSDHFDKLTVLLVEFSK